MKKRKEVPCKKASLSLYEQESQKCRAQKKMLPLRSVRRTWFKKPMQFQRKDLEASKTNQTKKNLICFALKQSVIAKSNQTPFSYGNVCRLHSIDAVLCHFCYCCITHTQLRTPSLICTVDASGGSADSSGRAVSTKKHVGQAGSRLSPPVLVLLCENNRQRECA
jgi:hypothetical protein